ncbi:hypothetical protein [Pseudoalteromonas sp. T1lg88]|uniref:hypothetical protein n=1 Tax=Pseudoalteromonas sp. T1lg88 TaxID=2077104 RepID=UPI000CF65D9C|nr:hypothetical protein [Pseudoalteromonas sp. T1lg88]
MGKAKPVTLAGRRFETQGDVVAFFNSQKQELLPDGPITEGELFDMLKDLYERYCNNSPGYELNGRLIEGFIVAYEKRQNNGSWSTTACFKVHFSNGEIRPFSIKKAVKSVADSTI